MSWALRHKPEAIGLVLQDNGWVGIDEFLQQAAKHGRGFTEEELREVVAQNNKQRFAIDEEQRLIRARQGHSTKVSLQFEERQPPEWLYHGTVAAAIDNIKADGLQKMKRHHVHLSPDQDTATQVGNRRGKAIILQIDSKRMSEDGYAFYLSENGVWLVEEVPSGYIVFPS